MLLETLVTE